MQTTSRPWRRSSTRGAWLWLAFTFACGDSDKAADSTDPPAPPRTSVRMDAPQIRVAANDPKTRAPFDATPSPDAKDVFYTALGEAEGEAVPGVFAIAAEGGEIRTLALGDPLTAPVNISVSLDGKRLFVADPAASLVFTLPSEGGTPAALAGTEGFVPRGLVVAKLRDAREYVYFTGRAPDTQLPGVFRVSTAGGAVETLAAGEPFGDPAGVAVDSRAVAYVVETGTELASARVIRVADGKSSTFVDGIGVGFPAGITLSRDDKTLLVSGLDPETKRDVVYIVDTATRDISRLTETVGAFHEPAGLHRAHDADVFAWADSQANDTGTVYLLTP